jgi:hypothetical protein
MSLGETAKMHIILRYPNGKRVDALLLSREHDRLRVAIQGRNDTLELKLVRERWVDDDGQKVSIEAMVIAHPATMRSSAAGRSG